MEDEKDLIVSFALEDSERGIKSLTLLRTLFYEELLGEEERGVHVSLEGVTNEKGNPNLLKRINIEDGKVEIFSSFNEFQIDTSQIKQSEIDEMMNLLRKQNHDNRFVIQVA